MSTTPENNRTGKSPSGSRVMWALIALIALLIALGFVGVGGGGSVNGSINQALSVPTQTAP